MAAYLGHYDPPFVQEANDAVWRSLRGHALDLGLPAPATLDRTRDFRAIWADPDLAFAQTCGLPLTTSLADRVRLIAAPIYDFAGCTGPNYRSFIVVRAASSYEDVSGLAGARVAINSRDSHSGYTALRHVVAPLARSQGRVRRYFGAEVLTGGHLASLLAVGAGTVDACACDCITYGLIARHRPDQLAGLRILAETEAAPVPPYITAGAASDGDVAAWQEALRRSFADPDASAARAALGLRDFAIVPLDAYRRIGDMAAVAEQID